MFVKVFSSTGGLVHGLNEDVHDEVGWSKLITSKRNLLLKLYKGQQNTKFSLPPKNQQNFVHFFVLATKKWLKQKIKAFDDLN